MYYLPTMSSSVSPALVRILLQISIVNIVELLLKMEVKDDMSAAIMTASMRPLAPVGIKFIISMG